MGPGVAQPLPPSVLPGLGPASIRVAVDVGEPPWRGLVRVQTEVGVRCTGALIGPSIALTAAHCLFGRGTGRLVRPGSIHVLSGYARGAYDGQARARTVEIGAGFALGPDGRPLPSSAADADWAVLTLDTALGTADRVLPLVRAIPPAGTPVMLGGYEQDRAQVILADLECRMLGPARIGPGPGAALLLRHSCAATRGASGAPLLARVPGSGPGLGWAVIGVATIAGLGASGGYAVPAGVIATR